MWRRRLTAVITASGVVSVLLVPVPSVQAEPALPDPAEAIKPAIIWDPIPYPAKRKKQMAKYAWRHYGINSWKHPGPKQIVLHFTVSSTYKSVWYHFASNTAGGGQSGTKAEKPGGCSQFVVGKNGKIYQLVPLDVMCRTTVGLNHVSFGIEVVEERSASRILNRPKQLRGLVKLVRWLQVKYGISKQNVIGHATANKSPYFLDLQGWYNDHSDWNAAQVRQFRRLL